jgi:hypothetical protein
MMGAALPSVPSPMVEVNGGMLDTDRLCPARPSECRFPEPIDTRFASVATNSGETFESLTSRGDGV